MLLSLALTPIGLGVTTCKGCMLKGYRRRKRVHNENPGVWYSRNYLHQPDVCVCVYMMGGVSMRIAGPCIGPSLCKDWKQVIRANQFSASLREKQRKRSG